MTMRRSGRRLATSFPRLCPVQFRRQFPQHGDIVAGLKGGFDDQRLAANPVQRIFQLRQTVGRVDIDQDQPGIGGAKLHRDPFGEVGRHDADAFTRLQPECKQPRAERLRLAPQPAPGPAEALMRHHQRPSPRPAPRGLVQHAADRQAKQRIMADTVKVAWF
jgi:hypothetical protein